MEDKKIFDLIIRVNTKAKIDDEAVNKVCSILKTAFSDRAVSIDGYIEGGALYLGINLNANADFNRTIDPGPHPKDPEAAAFRKFWGDDKSKLSRFPDGSLLESVEWGSEPIKDLTVYALQKHFSPDVTIDIASRDLSPIFSLPCNKTVSTTLNCKDAFDELARILNSLKLTVGIRSISPYSPFIRGTSVFPYEPVTKGRVSLCPHSIQVLARLESSSAWPIKLEPLLKFKVAVYIEISELLTKKNIQSQAHFEGVYVLLRGYLFEIKAVHDDELYHFKKTPHGDKVYFLEQIQLRHHSFISALGSRYSSFYEATRASIRWVRSKGITSQYLSHEAIELMMASIYMNTTERPPPAYAFSGLLRFLDLCASFKNKSNNIVTINDVVPSIETKGLPLILVSDYCQCSEFTKNSKLSQNNIIIEFLRTAAAQSLDIAIKNPFKARVALKRVFAIPISHWKIEFVFNPKMRPYSDYYLFCEKKSKKGMFETKTEIPLKLDQLYVDFDPAISFVNEIIERFGSYMNFWFDEFGGQKLGISYKNDLLKGKEINEDILKYAHKMDDSSNSVATDIESIVQQIRIIGGDLILSVNNRL